MDLISVNFPSTFDFSAIEFVGQDSLMALTGSTWQTAELSISNDAGISWDNNQIFNKKIFSLSHQTFGRTIGAGIDHIWEFAGDGSAWHNNYKEYRFYRDADVSAQGTILSCGGEAFHIGYIDVFTKADTLYNRVLTNHELDAIRWLGGTNWIAAGYGLIIHSPDDGNHWDTLAYSGDHFVDIQVLSTGSVFIVGASGSVWKTNKDLSQFKKLRKAQTSSFGLEVINTSAWASEQVGILCGLNGHMVMTENGGASWTPIDADIDAHIYASSFGSGYFWLGCQSGKLYKFLL